MKPHAHKEAGARGPFFFLPEVNKHTQAVGNAEAWQARLRHLPQCDHLPAANMYQLLVYAALIYWCMRP